jgi:hypothetical protein
LSKTVFKKLIEIIKFDVGLYFALTEKVIVCDEGQIGNGLLDGTEVECIIE